MKKLLSYISIERFKHKVCKKALCLSIFMVVCSYMFSNLSASLTGEPNILQGIELAKDYLDLGSPEKSAPDSIVFVNVSYDRELVDYDDGINEGNIDITDRRKLIQLLEYAKDTDYRYIVLDIAFADKLYPKDSLSDSLFNLIQTLPRIVVAKSNDFTTDERLNEKEGLVDYVTTVFDDSFTKIPLIEGDTKALAMHIFEDLHDVRIKSHCNLLYTCENQIVRRCIYPKMYINNRNLSFLNLGSMLLNGTMYTRDDIVKLLTRKIIVVGAISGPLDKQNTYIGNLSGAVINANIYLSLCNGAYKIPWWLWLLQLTVFYMCGLVIFQGVEENNQKKKNPILLLWAYYSAFLTVLVALIYIATGEAYDIMFTAITLTIIHWLVKTKRRICKQ